MASDLLVEGVQLMVVGMGTVFVFLTLLVLATGFMSRLVLRFQPEVVEGEDGEVRGEEVAAITAAIAAHRRRGT